MRVFAALALWFALIGARESRALGLEVIPGLTLEGDWDSNVFNSSTRERSDYVLRVRPTLALGIRTLGTTFTLQGMMTADEYAKYHELDRLAAVKSVNLYPSDPIRIGQNMRIRPTAYYVEMIDFGRRAFADTIPGGAGTVPGEGVDLAVRSERTTTREYSASVDMSYSPTGRIDTDVRGSALRQQLLNTPTSVQDFWVYSGHGTAYYRLGPRLQSGVYLRYGQTDYDEGPTIRIYQASLATRFVVREGQVFEARGGVSESRQETRPPTTARSPYGFLSMDSTWSTLHAVATAEYGIEQGGILRAPTKRFLGRLLLEKGLSARTSAEVVGAYQRSELSEPAVPETITVYSASLTLRYLLYRWATVRCGASHFLQESDIPATRDLRRTIAFLGIDLVDTFRVY